MLKIIFFKDPADTLLAGLDVDEKTGELIGDWEKALGDKITKDDVAIEEPIPQTDANGNTTTINKWLVKPQIIEQLFKDGKTADALNLQNKRNMVLALQGDNQALAKSQLETFTMLGYQIERLNATVAELGNIQNEMLKQTMDEEQLDNDFANEKGNDLVNYQLKSSRKWQYNKYGGVELITDTKKDTTGILGN